MSKELQIKIPLSDKKQQINAGFSVLFSGGLDSTAVPLRLGEKFTGDIHLMTLDHNYGHLFVKWSEKHANDLKKIYGENRVHHTIFNISGYFKRITLTGIKDDFFKYSHFIWCLGCMLSILTRVIINNLIHKIPFAFICSSVGGEYAIMSAPSSIGTKREVTLRYGIDYRAPLLELEMRKPEERSLLVANDIWPGQKILKGVQGVQPICIPGFMHIMDNLFDIHTIPDPEKIKAYILAKSEIMHQIIEEYFDKHNLDLEEHIAELKVHLAAIQAPFEKQANGEID